LFVKINALITCVLRFGDGCFGCPSAESKKRADDNSSIEAFMKKSFVQNNSLDFG
jgi:hypothetical protein